MMIRASLIFFAAATSILLRRRPKHDFKMVLEMAPECRCPIVVYADGSLLLQFKESSLFQPVKFARLQSKPSQGEDLAAQRRAQQAELDRMLAAQPRSSRLTGWPR
jgi:hypothetical protein